MRRGALLSLSRTGETGQLERGARMLYSDYIYGVADSRARFEEVLRASEQARLVGFASSTKDPPKSLFARSAALVMAMFR
jgi:hypothetical protein